MRIQRTREAIKCWEEGKKDCPQFPFMTLYDLKRELAVHEAELAALEEGLEPKVGGDRVNLQGWYTRRENLQTKIRACENRPMLCKEGDLGQYYKELEQYEATIQRLESDVKEGESKPRD